MHEKIVIAPSVNGNELLRTLARYGVNTIGLRIMNSSELASYALMKAGTAFTEIYVDSSSQAALIYSLLGDIKIFSAASYEDAGYIASTLNMIRMLAPYSEEETIHEKLKQGEFSDNSAALSEIYDRYISFLSESNYIDGIQLIRKAVSLEKDIDIDIITLKEYPLSPLEQRLAEKVSGGNVHETDLCEFMNIECKPLSYDSITEAYGIENEIEYIISAIYDNNIPLDKCVIALTSPSSYSQIISELAAHYDIPVTFGCGQPILNSHPAQLLKEIYKWMTTGYYGVDSLKSLVHSLAFDSKKLREKLDIQHCNELDELLKTAGNLRLCCDKNINSQRISNYISAFPEKSDTSAELQKLASEFERGISYLVSEYSIIREGNAARIDRSALVSICRELDSFAAFSDNDIAEIIPVILEKNIGAENSKGGSLHVCTISQALSCIRENIFIAGLSAENFPGSPAENYLVTDNDLRLFGENVPTSENTVFRNKAVLLDLLRIANALDSVICFSYSGFDTAELKEENASSVLFEIFSECTGEASMKCFEKSLCHAGYFDNNIGISRLIGKEYNIGSDIAYRSEKTDSAIKISSDIVLSPSAVETYFSCPRKFYYKHILKIKVPETDDVFAVISPNELGNLIHEILKDTSKEKISPDDLYKLASARFDRFITGRPPINEHKCKDVRNQFLGMVLTGQLMSKDNEVIESEMEIQPVDISGIKLEGRLDSLERLPSGEYIIADYKTGSRINHKEDDIETCLQVLLYAAMLKKERNIIVSGGEYRYLRYNKAICCHFTESVEFALNTMLGELASALESGSFPTTNNCDYCEYKNICRKENENG